MSVLKRLAFASGLAFAVAGSAAALDLVETPSLAPQVEAGALPPVADRVPSEPLVGGFETLGRAPGRSGGTLRVLLPKDKDVRLMNVWGYARLVGYDENFELKPDILARVDVEDGRIFTLHLRPGHKWSDGQPFTSEDFRYWWEDVANNPELRPSGPPTAILAGDVPPTVEIVDATTVRYVFPAPNPRFLAALAAARDPYIYAPAHYLKRFHAKYGDAADIAALVEREKVRNWAELHNRKDSPYDNDNPDHPTLQPWAIQAGGGPVYRFVRNPYFHRVDPNGVQLPYIDAVEARIVESGLVAMKSAAGDVDLQARGLSFAEISALKAAEARGGFSTLLWPVTKGSQVALSTPISPSRTRSGARSCATSASAARSASPSTGTTSTRRSISGWGRRPMTASCPRARSTTRAAPRSGPRTIPRRRTPSSTRSA